MYFLCVISLLCGLVVVVVVTCATLLHVVEPLDRAAFVYSYRYSKKKGSGLSLHAENVLSYVTYTKV